MKLFRRFDDVPTDVQGGALAIGNFDGVHKGHARIVSRLVQLANERDAAAIVLTFDPHPVRLLRPDQAPPPLTWTERKASLLADLGVDVVIAYPTDRALLEMDETSFFQSIVTGRLGARAMVEGPNFFFGHNRRGDVNTLARFCEAAGVQLEIVPPVLADGQPVSSSRIRQWIAAGQVELAAQWLTAPYRVRGMVTHGAARGAGLGFPTANLEAVDTLVPGTGIYAGQTWVEGRMFWAAIHVGPCPTFGERTNKVEVHVLDFDGSLYGQPLEVAFVAPIRAVVAFGSAEELCRQVEQDVLAVRHISRQWARAGQEN